MASKLLLNGSSPDSRKKRRTLQEEEDEDHVTEKYSNYNSVRKLRKNQQFNSIQS